MLSPREKVIAEAAVQWRDENPFGTLPPDDMFEEIEYIVNNIDDGGADLPPGD